MSRLSNSVQKALMKLSQPIIEPENLLKLWIWDIFKWEKARKVARLIESGTEINDAVNIIN